MRGSYQRAVLQRYYVSMVNPHKPGASIDVEVKPCDNCVIDHICTGEEQTDCDSMNEAYKIIDAVTKLKKS